MLTYQVKCLVIFVKYCCDQHIVGTNEYKAAYFLQQPVDDILEDMATVYAKAEPKRKWLDALVRWEF